jgi:CPA2 family monovalent cation:H+ antiporter-2
VLLPAAVLCAVTTLTKLVTGWLGRPRGRPRSCGPPAWPAPALGPRAASSASRSRVWGSPAAPGPELGTLAAAYVLLTAIVGPLLARRG